VTEQRSAGSDWNADEALCRALLAASSDAIVAVDGAGVIVSANEHSAQLLGYADPDELLGESYLKLVCASDTDGPTGKPTDSPGPSLQSGEQWLLRHDGVRVPVEVRSSPIGDSGDRFHESLLMLRDISELKQLEHEHRAIFEATGDGMVIYTMEGIIVDANPAFCEMNGYTCKELVGRNVSMLVDPKMHDLLGEFIETLRSGGALHTRTTNVRKDGSTFPVDVHGTVFLDEDGQPLILGVARDVTEQLEAHGLLERRVAERTRELETVLEVSHNVASVLELEPLLSLILEQCLVVTDYRWAAVLGLEGDRLVRLAGSADGEPVLTDYGFDLGDPAVGSAWRALSEGECLIADELADDQPLARTYRQLIVDTPEMAGAAGARSWLLVPLRFQGRTIGAISLLHPQPGSYRAHHARLVRAIADQAAVAIENARLYRQAQQAAALEERQHLARELHDAVTQTLFSASLIAEMLPRLWERDPEAGRERLEDVRALTRGALAEMRTLLLELRPTAIVESELTDLLRQLGEVLTGRTRIPVAVVAHGDGMLPAEVKLAFYRVAQEALNNVNKHARASQVDALLCLEQQTAELTIRDDGCGFDLGASGGDGFAHFGLTTMRERAEAVGATLSVQSKPGHGTEVHIHWRETKRGE
jgi:PAS domain S-box-containing protein